MSPEPEDPPILPTPAADLSPGMRLRFASDPPADGWEAEVRAVERHGDWMYLTLWATGGSFTVRKRPDELLEAHPPLPPPEPNPDDAWW